MATMQHARPSWYTHEDDTAWERVKEAFRRDWRQTKHDFGGNEPDLNQHVGDTISQAAGSKSIPPASMPNTDVDEFDDAYDENQDFAYRFGYAAYRHHGNCCEWNAETEDRLRNDWGDDVDWDESRRAVRRGWFFGKNQDMSIPRKM